MSEITFDIPTNGTALFSKRLPFGQFTKTAPQENTIVVKTSEWLVGNDISSNQGNNAQAVFQPNPEYEGSSSIDITSIQSSASSNSQCWQKPAVSNNCMEYFSNYGLPERTYKFKSDRLVPDQIIPSFQCEFKDVAQNEVLSPKSILEKDDSLVQHVHDLLQNDNSIKLKNNEYLFMKGTAKDSEFCALVDNKQNNKGEDESTMPNRNNTKSFCVSYNNLEVLNTGNVISTEASVSTVTKTDSLENLNASKDTEYGELPQLVDIPEAIVDRVQNMKLKNEKYHADDSNQHISWKDYSCPDSILSKSCLTKCSTGEIASKKVDTIKDAIAGDIQFHTVSDPSASLFSVEQEKVNQLQKYIENKTSKTLVFPQVDSELSYDLNFRNFSTKKKKLDFVATKSLSDIPVMSIGCMDDNTCLLTKNDSVSLQIPICYSPINCNEIQNLPVERSDPEGMSPVKMVTAPILRLKSEPVVNKFYVHPNAENSNPKLSKTQKSNFSDNENFVLNSDYDSAFINTNTSLQHNETSNEKPNLFDPSEASYSNSIDSLAVHVKALLNDEEPQFSSSDDHDETSNLSGLIKNFEKTDLWKFVTQFMHSNKYCNDDSITNCANVNKPLLIASPDNNNSYSSKTVSESSSLSKEKSINLETSDNNALQLHFLSKHEQQPFLLPATEAQPLSDDCIMTHMLKNSELHIADAEKYENDFLLNATQFKKKPKTIVDCKPIFNKSIFSTKDTQYDTPVDATFSHLDEANKNLKNLPLFGSCKSVEAEICENTCSTYMVQGHLQCDIFGRRFLENSSKKFNPDKLASQKKHLGLLQQKFIPYEIKSNNQERYLPTFKELMECQKKEKSLPEIEVNIETKSEQELIGRNNSFAPTSSDVVVHDKYGSINYASDSITCHKTENLDAAASDLLSLIPQNAEVCKNANSPLVTDCNHSSQQISKNVDTCLSLCPQVDINDSYLQTSFNSSDDPIVSLGSLGSDEDSDIALQKKTLICGSSKVDIQQTANKNRFRHTIFDFQQMSDKEQLKFLQQVLDYMNKKKSVSNTELKKKEQNNCINNSIALDELVSNGKTTFPPLPTISSSNINHSKDFLYHDEIKANIIMRKLLKKINHQKQKKYQERHAASSTPQNCYSLSLTPEASSIQSNAKSKKLSCTKDSSKINSSPTTVQQVPNNYKPIAEGIVLNDRSVQTMASEDLPSTTSFCINNKKISTAVQTSDKNADEFVSKGILDSINKNKDKNTDELILKDILDNLRVSKSIAWFEPFKYEPYWKKQDNNEDMKESRELLTLQKAFITQKHEFISRSRERQRRIAINSDERRLQEIWEEERQQLFSSKKQDFKSQLSEPCRRSCQHLLLNRKEMIAKTRNKYQQLPEVLKKKEEQQRKKEYASYRIKAQLYKKKIQRKILGRHTS